jgi:hypothetical protein
MTAVALVAPRMPFAQIAAAAAAAGLRGGPTTLLPPVLPGEPELAEWARGEVLVRYELDPPVLLRVLSTTAEPHDPRWRRMLDWLVVVDEATVAGWLRGRDADELLRGVLAVRVLGLPALRPLVHRLEAHPHAVVAAVAACTRA